MKKYIIPVRKEDKYGRTWVAFEFTNFWSEARKIAKRRGYKGLGFRSFRPELLSLGFWFTKKTANFATYASVLNNGNART